MKLLLYGPPGVGKTSIADMVERHVEVRQRGGSGVGRAGFDVDPLAGRQIDGHCAAGRIVVVYPSGAPFGVDCMDLFGHNVHAITYRLLRDQ